MRLLDLFCGAGGASMGYHRAGFEVTGVDIIPQPRYPFEFVEADALQYPLDGYDVIHASPPCQRWSVGTPNKNKHPDYIDSMRDRMCGAARIYVIENVPHAPIRPDIAIEGGMVGLPLIKRRRHFEIEPSMFCLRNDPYYPGPVITVTGHGTTSGNRATWGRNIRVAEMRKAMGIDWMNRDELSQAIPPAYTEWIGKRIMKYMLEETR